MRTIRGKALLEISGFFLCVLCPLSDHKLRSQLFSQLKGLPLPSFPEGVDDDDNDVEENDYLPQHCKIAGHSPGLLTVHDVTVERTRGVGFFKIEDTNQCKELSGAQDGA